MGRGRKKGEGTGLRAVTWEEPFLAALARTGNVAASAVAAGIDVSGAFNRRRRSPTFREAWLTVLAEREARAGGLVLVAEPVAAAQGMECVPAVGGGALVPRTSRGGAQLARVGTGRWGARAEEAFLGELAGSANVKAAAAAAGFSAEAVYRRRLKVPAFAQAWDAAIEVGKARLKALLVEAAGRSFDPDSLPVGEEGAGRHVSVGEAIHILRLKGGEGSVAAAAQGKDEGVPGECGCSYTPEQVDELRMRIFNKLQRVREIGDREMQEAGWLRYGDHWIPPGWVPGPGASEADALAEAAAFTAAAETLDADGDAGLVGLTSRPVCG